MSLKKIKGLASDSMIYGLSGVITRMVTIFLVPLYTRVFNPADYGVLSLINTTFVLLGILSICALDSASGRWYYENVDEEDQKRTFSSWFWFQFAVALGLSLLMVVCTPLAARLIFERDISEVWIIWLIPSLNLLTNILPNIIWNWFRLQRRATATLVFNISQSLLSIALTIFFVLVLKMGILGVLLALLCSSFVFSMVAVVLLYRWIGISYFQKQRLQEMLRFSMPLVPAALAYWLLNSTNAFFIAYFKDTAEVGLFAIGASLAAGVGLFTNAFQQAWGPFAYSIMHEPGAKEVYAKVFEVFGVISGILILFIFLFSPEMLMVLTQPKYYGAAWVGSILSINVILISFTYIASIGASIMKNTMLYAKAVLVAAIITTILNFLLIPVWGKEGSAIATVLGQVLVPVYLFYRTQRLFPIPYPFHIVFIFLMISIGFGVGARVAFDSVLYKIIVFLLYISFICLFYRRRIQFYLKERRLNFAA